jgi:hypothetical protein
MQFKWAVSVRGHRYFGAVTVLFALFFLCPLPVHASGTTPAEILQLVPAKAKLLSDSWGMFETEFGYSYGANLHAGFPDSVSCDITIGPELRVELKGDTWSDEPPMLDLQIQVYDESIKRAREGLPETVATFANNSYVKSVGAVQEEKSPVGHILAIEYSENCTRHPDGPQTILQAFARKDGAILTLFMWIDAELPTATAMAKNMLDRFQQLDIPTLLDTAVTEGNFTPEFPTD